ncbi:MAG TPA: glycosyltransferase family 4 protein [Desulfosporosinus sp.]|nr:glycosyltransferase family 4 protein [Desulfosporosinus sp.]
MQKILKLMITNFKEGTCSHDLREITTMCERNCEVLVCAKHDDGLELLEHKAYTVKRFRLNPQNKRGMVNKAKRLLSYVRQCEIEAKRFMPDVISAHDLVALVIAEHLKRRLKNGCRILYDSHELTSKSKGVKNNNIIGLLTIIFERLYINKADAVMVVSESIALYNEKKYNLKERPTVVRNIPHTQKLTGKRNLFREYLGIGEDKKILLYQGFITEGRGIEKIIDALNYLGDEYVLVIMGDGDKEKYKTYASRKNVVQKVLFHDAVPYATLIDYTSSADLGIALIKNFCLSYYYCLPNKIFEYIQAGLPVLCSDFPDMTSIVKGYGIGDTTDPENSEQIANMVEYMFSKPNYQEYINNMKKAQRELCWEEESKKLIELYDKLLKTSY